MPHSEIFGLTVICTYPKLIAAYHVLHRLLAPRHPLCALQSLIPCLKPACQRGLPIRLAPWTGASLQRVGVTTHICRKNLCIWESEYIQGPQARRAGFHHPAGAILFCSQSIIFLSIWMSKSGRLLSCVRNQPCPCGKWYAIRSPEGVEWWA